MQRGKKQIKRKKFKNNNISPLFRRKNSNKKDFFFFFPHQDLSSCNNFMRGLQV